MSRLALAALLCGLAPDAFAQGADEAWPLCKDLKVPGPHLTIPVSLGAKERALPMTGAQSHADMGAVMMRREARTLTDLVTSITGPFEFAGGKGRKTFNVVVPRGPLVPFKNEVQEVYVSTGARVVYTDGPGPQPLGIYFLVPIDDRTKLISHLYWGNAAEDYVVSGARMGHTICAEAAPGFTQELAYSALSGKMLTLTYRAFTDGSDRAEQRVTHDLAASDKINIKGAVIRVIQANDAAIRFVVEKPFSER